ncbi:MAG TPA: hypothetical protein VF752_14975 [Thermoleophilaceae bacterium]
MADPALTPELALPYLAELSTDIRAAVLLDQAGRTEAHSLASDESAERLRELTLELFERAEKADAEGRAVAEVEVSTGNGSVYAVRSPRWTIAVVSGRFALSSLMLYDLRSVLSDLEPKAA